MPLKTFVVCGKLSMHPHWKLRLPSAAMQFHRLPVTIKFTSRELLCGANEHEGCR